MVRSAADRLGHDVRKFVDEIEVVAGAAGHLVDFDAAIQRIVAKAAEQDIEATAADHPVVAEFAVQLVADTIAAQRNCRACYRWY